MTDKAIVVHDENPYAVMPVMDFHIAATRRQAVIDFTNKMMVKGTDYGVIPGTGTKPTLLKPGAEKLASLFGLSPHFDIADSVLDWTGADHGGEPFFYLQYRCTLYRGDLLVGQGLGSCNSWEKKYRYRTVYPNRATPDEKATGRLETRNGRNGAYQVYVIKNADPADVMNTIDKMAQKRALVAAVLIAVNASEMFTQDIEDYSDIVDGSWEPATDKPQAKPTASPGPSPSGPSYADGSPVDDRALSHYRQYVSEHDGAVPNNVYHLRNWYKKHHGNGNGATAPEPEPVAAQDTPLFDEDPDAAQAALATATGELD